MVKYSCFRLETNVCSTRILNKGDLKKYNKLYYAESEQALLHGTAKAHKVGKS